MEYGTVLRSSGREPTQSYCGTCRSGANSQAHTFITTDIRCSPARHLVRRPTPVTTVLPLEGGIDVGRFSKKGDVDADPPSNYYLALSFAVRMSHNASCIKGFGQYKYTLRSFRDTLIS